MEFINGEAFQNLNKLTWAVLDMNYCIDDSFQGSTRIAAMPLIVKEKCGFNENADRLLEKKKQEQKIQMHLNEVETFVGKTNLENCRPIISEMIAKTDEIKILKTKLQNKDSDIGYFEKQIEILNTHIEWLRRNFNHTTESNN